MKIHKSTIIYMIFLCIGSFNAEPALAVHPISHVDIITPPDSTCGDSYKQNNASVIIQGLSTGSYYWPTDGIEIDISAECLDSTLQEVIREKMSDAGFLGYLKKTDIRKVYVNNPEVRLINGGIVVSVKITGWDRDDTLFGYTPKRYWSIEVSQNFAAHINDWKLTLLPAGAFTHTDISNVSPYLEGVADVFVFLGINFIEFGADFFAIVTGNSPIFDLRDTIIESTEILGLFKHISALSDPGPIVKEVLDMTTFDLSINPDYMRLSFTSFNLYESARNEFRSVAKKASDGLLSDQDADAIFDAIQYPQGLSASFLLTGKENENNRAPTAFSASILETNFNNPIVFKPPTSDPDGDPLSYSVHTPPSHGTVSIFNGSKYKLRYTPDSDFAGFDQFKYRVEDPYGLSDIGVINVFVNENQPPTAFPRALVLNLNVGVAFTPPAFDPDEERVTVSIHKAPSHGTVSVIREGSRLQYIPDFDFEGVDQFEYRVDDPNGLFSTAAIDVSVVRPKRSMIITKTGTGDGSITSNPDGIDCGAYCIEDFAIESSITLTPMPAAGSVFRDWDGDCSGTGTCTVTIDSAKIIIARFDTAPESFALTVNKTGTGTGRITSSFPGIDCGMDCTENYTNGSNTRVTLNVIPDTGSVFRGWNGACSGTGTCSVIMFNDKTITATFTTSTPKSFIVSNLNDSDAGSLRQAILDANANPGDDLIVFQNELSGTITLLNGQIDITDSVVLNGPGASILAISGNNASRIFEINPGTIGTVAINGLTLKEGHDVSGNGGGGFIINTGTVTLNNCTLSNNSADVGGGGGIRNFGPGALTVSNSTVSGNSAIDEFDQGDGGGIRNDQGILTIINSTVSGNSAANGGGITIDDGTLTISNSTVASNSALSGGGGIFNGSGKLILANSLIIGNNAPTDREIQNFGAMISQGHNLFGENGVSGVTEGTALMDNDLILADFLSTAIGLLANNGGQTQTHLPVAGGPAVDSGDNSLIFQDSTTDQRGIDFPRIMNETVDIGAVERTQITAVQELSVSPSSVTSFAGGTATFNISGGTSPYTAASDDTSVATVSLNGNTVTVTSVAVGTTNITITDSASNTANVDLVVKETSSRECATFNLITGTLHVLCLDLGSSYRLDLQLIGGDPISFRLSDFGENLTNDTNANGECATFNLLTGTLHVPCLDFGGGNTYWLDFQLMPGDPITFHLIDFGEN